MYRGSSQVAKYKPHFLSGASVDEAGKARTLPSRGGLVTDDGKRENAAEPSGRTRSKSGEGSLGR